MSRNTDGRVPFHRPSVGVEEEEAVLRVLRSGWLTTAGEARAFEKEFALAVGSANAISVSSATAGLHLALEAEGVREGGLVITTPYTFTSSAEVIRYLGADPLFVDIRREDLNIDPARIEEALRGQARRVSRRPVQAILPVHIGGHPCELDAITELAAAEGIPVVEDAAHSFPSRYRGRHVGTWGGTGVYSFYATKTLTTGEGGMVVTDDAKLARRMAIMRLHGIDREVWDRYTSEKPSWHYQVVEAGFKYNMPDLLAAIGRVQLRKAEDFARRRHEIARLYAEQLGDRDYIELPAASNVSSWHLYVIRIVRDRLSIDRDEFIAKLAGMGIGTSVHYIPLHLMPYYRKRYGFTAEDFPVSLDSYERAMSLPIYPGLTDEEVGRVSDAVRAIGDGALA